MSESIYQLPTLGDLAHATQGTVHGADTSFLRVHTDSRSIQRGDCFFALSGDHFDGHVFVAAAAALGAVAAVVTRQMPVDIPQIVVDDTLLALQKYAAFWRMRFDIPVIGVTGSNGKTTTKQLLASVFATRGSVLATEGNLNNHIGVPLTLCRLRAEHRTAVIEMGANHAGEIATLARIANPTLGIVTQAGDAHLEGFGSRQGVARAKGELFAALNGGMAIINLDDAYAGLWSQLAAESLVYTFGFSAHADIRAEDVVVHPEGSQFNLHTPLGQIGVALPLPGKHNVANALAAAAAGTALGLSLQNIAQGLHAVAAPKGRVNSHQTPNGATIIDDSYNANPSSLLAGMQMLAQRQGRRYLVLGNMAELGEDSATLHRQAGEQAKALGLTGVFALGPHALNVASGFGAGGHAFSDPDSLIATLKDLLADGGSFLIKGSRSARMERVVAALLDQPIHSGSH